MEYLSCEWIEHRRVFDYFELRFCCIPHSHGTKGFVPACKYKAGKLPIEEIRCARKKLIEQNNRDDVDSPCKGCHFLQKKEWEQPKDNIKFRQIEISNFSICNLKCNYCFTVLHEDWNLPKYGYDLLPVLKGMIETGCFEKDAIIGWGGGEPTILNNFDEIARLFLKNGLHQRIFTNAVRFSEIIAEGLRQRKISITTSVDAGTRETFKEIKGSDRYDVVWKNLERYAKTGGQVLAKYILRKGNSDPENIIRFVRKAKQCQIRRLVITPDMIEIEQDSMTEQTIYAFARMVHEAKMNGIELYIGREYLDPENLKLVQKYIPLRRRWWRYCLYRLNQFFIEAIRKTKLGVRRLIHIGTTRRAIKQAEESIALPDISQSRIFDLMDYQTRYPNSELRSKLTNIVKMKAFSTKRFDNNVTVLGISEDAWTLDGKPCYVVVDNLSSLEPHVQELWITCSADEKTLPLTLTITDGINNDIVYTYYKPDRIRITLPAIPAGQSGIFAVSSDKSWIPSRGDTRKLGIQLSL